jgi:hypothetical protein
MEPDKDFAFMVQGGSDWMPGMDEGRGGRSGSRGRGGPDMGPPPMPYDGWMLW